MTRFFMTCVFVALLATMGCSSVPPKQDPANWHGVMLGDGILGSWYADAETFILRFGFTESMSEVSALRAVDLPGNGFDLYTYDGVVLTKYSNEEYEMTIPRYFQLDHQLFFRIEWKKHKSLWPISRLFLFEGNQLYYSED